MARWDLAADRPPTTTERIPVHHPSRPLVVTAAVVAVGVLLAGCGAGTAPPSPVAAQSFEVPSTAVTATVTTPEGWDRAGQDAPLVVRSQTPFGDPGFTANVVVTTSDPGPSTLTERVSDAAQYLQESEGWTVDPTQPGPIEVAGLPAHRFGGTRVVDGIEVSQVETIVEVPTPSGSAFVYVTESSASKDADGAAQARAVTDSLVVAPVG